MRGPGRLRVVALLGVLGGALASAWLLRETVWGVFRVPSASMVPTLLPGDVVVVDRTAYGLRLPWSTRALAGRGRPRPGDVVVARSPRGDGALWVKRVLAVEGQTIGFERGFAVIDGASPDVELVGTRAYVGDDCRPVRGWTWSEAVADVHTLVVLDDDLGSLARDVGPVRVPPGHVFLVGDSRDRSADSRALGLVRVDDVLGRVTHVALSLDPCTGRRRADRAGHRVEPPRPPADSEIVVERARSGRSD